VRFAFLPGGLDPDDLIRQSGPDAFAAELAKTTALFDVLWAREEQGHDLSTPEQRAAFETRLKGLVARIGEATVRTHYERELRETFFAFNRTIVREIARGEARRQPGQAAPRRNNVAPDWRARERARLGKHHKAPVRAASGVLASPELAQRTQLVPAREALLLRTLLNHPWLIDEHSEAIAALPLTAPPVVRLRDAILAAHALENGLDSSSLRSQLSVSGLGKLIDLVERSVTHRSDRFAEPDAPQTEVEAGWRHALALHERQVGLQKSLDAAVQAYHQDGSEDALARICEIQGLLARSSQIPIAEHGADPGD
jgi:DNA primase